VPERGTSSPGAPEASLAGIGLHGGRPVRVTLRPCDGPVLLRAAGRAAEARTLTVVSTQWATTVEAPGGAFRIATVEHAFAALAGLGVRSGLALEIDGDEMPLLDGAAAAWCAALESIGSPSGPPDLRVARPGVVEVGTSRYAFAPGDEVDVRVRLEPDDPRLAVEARWRGDARDFRARIAPARTFAFIRDVGEIARLGLARHVDPRAIVLVDRDAIHCEGVFERDEPARHKLLDLVGDFYVHGGPPRGITDVTRPGHTANLRAITQAVREGILVDASARRGR
jgi:UDP-3-O-[3-hydroxymyristoyl] N-acetylglucosamine deacetylase